MSKEWKEIESEYDAMEHMSCVPEGIRMVRVGHVFDEEKSVRWNREQVDANNFRYQEEAARLHGEKNKRRNAVYEEIYKFIQDEVGHKLPRRKAMVLWNYAWQRSHGCGIQEVKACLDELTELAAALLQDDVV